MYLGFLCVVFTAVAPVTEQCLTHRRHSRNTHLLREPAVVSFIFSLVSFFAFCCVYLCFDFRYLLSSAYFEFIFVFF